MLRLTTPSRPLWVPAQVLYLALLAITLASSASAALPKIDFNRMGRVGVAGAFSGLEFIDTSASANNVPTTFDRTTSTLFSRTSDGSLSPIGATNAGGKVSSACTLSDKVYFAGSFSSVGGQQAKNIASYTPSSRTFAALGEGLDGEVFALHCDGSSGLVWAGGAFKKGVATYRPSDNSWTPVPFDGLPGKVQDITPSTSGSSLYFSGAFLTSFQGNGAVQNGTSNPRVPSSSGSTPFSSSLVPIPLTEAELSPSPSTSQSGFSNVRNILCPTGDDGPGHSWFAEEGFSAFITARTYKALTASGIRLGNTHAEGRSTTRFSVTSIPDNEVLTLTYQDPTTQQSMTCSDSCPLSTDTSVPFQDFLFETRPITGVQLTLSQWNGAGPGLHLFQLLSDGAFASANQEDNIASCYSPNPSSSELTGKWTQRDAPTGIAGTTQVVLLATADGGNKPSVKWHVYVSASGRYDVYFLTPGCTNFQDCDRRIPVTLTVSPGGNLDPVSTTVNQQVQADARTQIYSGPLYPQEPNFTIDITLSVPEGQSGPFSVIADRIVLDLVSTDPNGDGSTTGGSTSSRRGAGFFEWPLNGNAINATGVIPNSTETKLDAAAFALFSATGNSASLAAEINIASVAAYSADTIFLGGHFKLPNGPSSIVAFKNGALAPLSGNGLNGDVTSMVIDGDNLFVAGAFSDTANPTQSGKLRGVARYDIKNDQWHPLGTGVNNVVSGLAVSSGKLTVVGAFSHLSNTDSGPSAGGLAIWDIANNQWLSPGGLIAGTTSMVFNSDSAGNGYLAGNVAAARQYGADGLAMLQNGDNGPVIRPLNARLEGPATAGSVTRRTTNWLPLTLRSIFPRQSPATGLPAALPAAAPAVLAGAFWTNTSTSTEVVILGGNFTFTSATGAASKAVAIYDPNSGRLSALQGSQVEGTVRALKVVGDQLFVGGEFTIAGVAGQGLAVYNLVQQNWDSTSMQGLQAANGAAVVVRSISTLPSNAGVLVVAGSFSGAGSVSCPAICSWDIAQKQWQALGSGVRGDVATVDYASSGGDILLAAGAIQLADGTSANVAQYVVANKTWVSLGSSFPGVATALGVNEFSQSSIFAAGRTADGSGAFLTYWNGQAWNTVPSAFAADTTVSQLQIVPLSESHSASGVIQTNRMLLISGSINLPSGGAVSSALYDGAQFYPYLASSSSAGAPGSISSFFHSFSTFSFDQRTFLATGVVILISIAIGAGIVFFLLLFGVLWTLYDRRHDKAAPTDSIHDEDDDSLHRPSSLLEHINAATRTAILGGVKSDGHTSGHKEDLTTEDHDHELPADESGEHRAETPFEGGVITGDDDDVNRPAHARYSFHGSGEGELPLAAGAQVTVLNDQDPEWWYVRDALTNREGVVPASYLF